MTIQEIAQALEAKYPSRKLLAIAINKPGSNERTGVVMMELTDDSAARYGVWFVNFYQTSNIYTVSGDYFHIEHYDLDGARLAAYDAFRTRIIP